MFRQKILLFRQIIRAVGANYYSLTAQPAMHANNSIDSNKVTFHYDIRHSFYFTSMLFRFLVVVDAYKNDVTGVFGNLQGIVLTLNLIEGSVDGMVEFQLYDEGGLVDIATGNHHKVGIALACGILAMDDILVSCPYICNGEYTSKRVLVVISKNTGVLVVSLVDGFGYCLLFSCNGVKEKSPGGFKSVAGLICP